MRLLFFWNENCPNSGAAKQVLDDLNLPRLDIGLRTYDTEHKNADDIDIIDKYSVMGTPTVILVDDNGYVCARWNSEVPEIRAVERAIRLAR